MARHSGGARPRAGLVIAAAVGACVLVYALFGSREDTSTPTGSQRLVGHVMAQELSGGHLPSASAASASSLPARPPAVEAPSVEPSTSPSSPGRVLPTSTDVRVLSWGWSRDAIGHGRNSIDMPTTGGGALGACIAPPPFETQCTLYEANAVAACLSFPGCVALTCPFEGPYTRVNKHGITGPICQARGHADADERDHGMCTSEGCDPSLPGCRDNNAGCKNIVLTRTTLGAVWDGEASVPPSASAPGTSSYWLVVSTSDWDAPSPSAERVHWMAGLRSSTGGTFTSIARGRRKGSAAGEELVLVHAAVADAAPLPAASLLRSVPA
jgi:hypothetical protein